MKFVEVKSLPAANKKKPYHCYKNDFDRFMRMNVKFARVIPEPGEYVNGSTVQSCLRRGAKDGGYPIDVKLISGECYLIRRDI